MQEEMFALQSNGTWTLVLPPTRKDIVGGKWVFSFKLNPDGSLAGLKS